MSTPRIWCLPCSTFSLTTKGLKLKKTWKCCLPFLFKKMQRHLWLSEWLPSPDLLRGRALHCTLKHLLRERSSERWPPVSEGRTSGVSLPTVVEYTRQRPGGEGKCEHSPSTPPQSTPRQCCLLQCVSSISPRTAWTAGISKLELSRTDLKSWGKASRCKI